jgi:hypothetical protein
MQIRESFRFDQLRVNITNIPVTEGTELVPNALFQGEMLKLTLYCQLDFLLWTHKGTFRKRNSIARVGTCL